MKKIYWVPILLIVANLAGICWVMIHFLNLSYPIVGHDYSLAVPALLDTYLHYHLNGLSIQWYTPSFGGGLPAYPNPNNGQFSLLGVLPLLFSPWQSIIISSIILVTIGGLASFYFFIKVLKLHWMPSLLGMVFFSANGFMLERLAVGHLGYQAFPLIAVLFILFMDSSIPRGIAGLVFALIVAMVVYQAGYTLIVFFGLTILLVLPLIYIYRAELFSWRRILTVLATGAVIAMIISASKLAAVYAFMRYFPRQITDTYAVSLPRGMFGILLQLLGTMNLAPLLWLTGVNPGLLPNYIISVTGGMYGWWEFDMSMSPIVFGITVLGIYSFIKRPKRYSRLFTQQKKWIAWILLGLFTWLTIEFVLATGLMYPLLSKLPILSSLHVNSRYAVAFIFPLAMVAAILFDKWSGKRRDRRSLTTLIIINVITLIPLGSYFMIKDDLQYRIYNVTRSEQIYSSIRSGVSQTITGIGDNMDNTLALDNHLSNLHPYDPIFGYRLEYFHPEIKPGSIWQISDGYYNMTNPSGYVFPAINGSRPFERIPVSQKAQLEAFASHRAPGWKIPLYQQVLDWVSGLTAASVVLFLLIAGIRKLILGFIRQKTAPRSSPLSPSPLGRWPR